MTVCGSLLMVSAVPTMEASELKRRSQNPCASMTAFGPFQVHSSEVNVRPSAGLTPRTSKKLSDTGIPLSRSGSPFPLRRLSPTP